MLCLPLFFVEANLGGVSMKKRGSVVLKQIKKNGKYRQ